MKKNQNKIKLEQDQLFCSLSNFLFHLGLKRYENPNYYNSYPIFWSLERVFYSYWRILVELDKDKYEAIHSLPSEIEVFHYRMRIFFDVVAELIVEILDLKNIRSFENKDSIHGHLDFFLKLYKRNSQDKQNIYQNLRDQYKKEEKEKLDALRQVYIKNKAWLNSIRIDRDHITHNNAQAITFIPKVGELTFGMMKPNGKAKKSSIYLEDVDKQEFEECYHIPNWPIKSFVNERMKDLWGFLNDDLFNLFNKFEKIDLRENERVSYRGIKELKDYFDKVGYNYPKESRF